MDVTRVSPRTARIATLGLGTAAGLVFALPVKTGSAACPPTGEGRGYCIVQEAWAPAAIKLTATVLVVYLLVDLLFIRLPAIRRRWREGERIVRREDGHGHDAIVADPVLAAANWGIVPERKPAWRVARPEPSPAAAAAVAQAVEPEPAPPPRPAPVRALNAEERFARSSGRHGRHFHVLSPEELRGRKLRRGADPALVVSCWSDATSARALPDDVRSGVSA